MTTPTPVLQVRNLFAEFATRPKPFRAVNDVSFTLNRGETLCLVGESGSGKSVTARSILQIIDPPGAISSGQIIYHDTSGRSVDIARLGPKSAAIRQIRGKEIAMIFQEPMSSLSPIHRIGQQIGEVLTLHEGLSRRDARTRTIELLAKVGIRDPDTAVDRYPFEYSGGMRQRAMIAMALACNPAVLIADEPTTALDVSVQAEILDLIRKLQEERGTAVLFITHDMGVVAQIADRVAVMRYGEIVEEGDVHTVFRAPQHAYTRGLLAAVHRLDRPSERRIAARADRPVGAPILTTEGLTKDFGASRAVDGVTVDLREGENLGVVGESGSGKTTMGRCLQRLYQINGGRIDYVARDGDRIDLSTLTDAQLRKPWREIRTVFQDPFSSLNPRMTVGQILAEPLRVLDGWDAARTRQRVTDLLDMVNLPASAANKYPHAFSGGQRQRISIARAIAPEPRVIIADEATSALDVNTRMQILDLMLRLQEELRLSYILISHDLSVIRYFCDRVAVMYHGKLVEVGPTEQVCTTPSHAYTRALLRAVPVADPSVRTVKVRDSGLVTA